MLGNIDPKMLDSLFQTVHRSIPSIRADIESFIQNPIQYEILENAYHSIQPIKDVAEMLGLSILHHIIASVAGTIEEIISGTVPTNEVQGAWFCRVIDQIEPYLRSLQSGDGRERDIVAEAVKSLRRYKGLPETDDDMVVDETMAMQKGMPEELPAFEVRQPETPRSDFLSPEVDLADFQMDFSAELLEGFLLEAEDYLDTIGRLLPIVGDQAEQSEQLLQVRRSVHTLKGSAGIVGLRAVSQLSHRMEDLLDELYDGNLPLTATTKDLLFATFDILEDFIRDKGAQGEFAPSAQELYHAYDVVLRGVTPETDLLSVSLVEQAIPVEETLSEESRIILKEQALVGRNEVPTSAVPQPTDVVRVPMARLDELIRLVGELAISGSVYEQQLTRLVRQVEELHLSLERLQRTATSIETQYEVSALIGNRGVSSHQKLRSPSRAGSEWSGIIEFDELEFDRYSEFHLMSRDLAETSADIGALGHEFKEILGEFDSYLTRESRLTSEIQDKLMQFRMIPLASLSTRLHRAVRVTARQRGKDVAFVLEGEEVQFDKIMLEELNEALLHLLRNAVDHGIESPAVRQGRGKPQQGLIRLCAFREGTQLVVKVSDDGAGLDPHRIRTTAMQNGLLSEVEASQWQDDQIYSLIFSPGFSTAEEISEVSGRGVGMDIVHTTVNRLKGRITVDSTPGFGLVVTIRLPLTLAIARVLLIQACGQTFALPLADVTQVMRVKPEAIEEIGDAKAIRLNKQVLPVIVLSDTLHLQPSTDRPEGYLPVVIAQAGDKQIAVLVDELLGGREVVVKNLGAHLRHIHGLIGSTLMGDGSIVLILNPGELVQDRQQAAPRSMARTTKVGRVPEALEIMIVDDSFSVRRVVANLVKSAGWQPILAKNGLEALEIIQRATHLPDLMLLDVEMPQMDGYELTSTLRAHAAYRQLPIVMLTSRSGEKHRRKAFEVGATEYLIKPYQDAVLIETIRHLVAQARGTTAA